MSDWNGQRAGFRLPKAEESKPLSGQVLVREALEDVDDDPRADCNRARDPAARDTNPFGPKANYIDTIPTVK